MTEDQLWVCAYCGAEAVSVIVNSGNSIGACLLHGGEALGELFRLRREVRRIAADEAGQSAADTTYDLRHG